MPKRWTVTFLFLFSTLMGTHGHAALEDGTAFGNWRVNCETDGEQARRGCFIVQNLVLKQGGQRVMQLAIGFVDETPEPIALVSLPLGISLPPGAEIQIDNAEKKRIAIERCEPNGCRAGLKLDEALVAQFREGKELSVTFYDAKRQPIAVPLSLEGFDQGLQALAANRS